MFCKKCGKEIEDGTNICSGCGAKTVKKMSKGKTILITVFAVLIITVIACAMGGESSGNAIIIENEYCQLGATYSFTPEEFINRYNKVIDSMNADNSFKLPQINEWISADLLEDGNISYTYAVSNELVYTIYTYKDTKVNSVFFSMSDDFQIQNGILFMTFCEAAAVNITNADTISKLFDIIRDNLINNPFNYKNSLVNFGEDGIVLGAVSNEKLDTIKYYNITESELE